jgi:hypothetical protein
VKKQRTTPLLLAAREYEGYTARGRDNIFANESGYTGEYFQWDGAFIDRVIKDANLTGLPTHVNTVSALAFYTRNGQLHSTPRNGDVVFYSFPSLSRTASFDPPHVGVVSDITAWKKDHSFRAIEAQISSGAPRAARESNGVYERVRYATDVLTFARVVSRQNPVDPSKERQGLGANTVSEKELVIVRPAYLTKLTTVQQAASAKLELRRAVEAVQLALSVHPAVRLQNADRGIFNAKTRSAYAAFQRSLGLPADNCNGLPTLETLRALSNNSTFFRAEG